MRRPIYDGYRDGVLRRFFTPKWLGAFLLAILAAVACYHLGWWQYGRHEYKAERNARLDASYRATPRPVTEVITTAPMPLTKQWTRVRATGSYGAAPQLYVRNRPNDGQTGFEVVAPFLLDAGGTVLVDRGWVAAAKEGAQILPKVPPPPTGPVVLTGWSLPGEESKGRALPAGQLASVNLREASSALHTDLLGGYVLLQGEALPDGSSAPRPQPLEPPDRSLGPHQAYAYQWWLTTPLGFVLIWFGIRRELRSQDPNAPAAPKKTRIWDEEDY